MTQQRTEFRIKDIRPVAEPGWRVVVIHDDGWSDDGINHEILPLAGWALVETAVVRGYGPPDEEAWAYYDWQAAWVEPDVCSPTVGVMTRVGVIVLGPGQEPDLASEQALPLNQEPAA